MFKTLSLYRFTAPNSLAWSTIEESLAEAAFVECGASQQQSVGWVAPRGIDHGALVEMQMGHRFMKLMIETKKVPSEVLKRKVKEQCDALEVSTGRKPGKKEKREITDDVHLALLPMAFTSRSSVLIWLDTNTGFMAIDASGAKLDTALTWMIKAMDGLTLQLVNTKTAPAAAMAIWLSTKEAPANFSVDRECELRAADESKAVVRYTRHALDTDEIAQHISMGKIPTRLALTWDDRVSFTLTDGLVLKKIEFLETVFEDKQNDGSQAQDNFDADVAITTAELSKLFIDLMNTLGGIVETE